MKPKPNVPKIPPPHPVAALFPMMEGKEFENFVEDIRKNGVRDKILPLSADGKWLLDGRNRLAACKKLGIEGQLRLVPQRDLDDEFKMIAFIISRNLHRRHLSSSQHDEMEAGLRPLVEAAAKGRQRAAGGDKVSERAKGERSPSEEGKRSKDHSGETDHIIAKMVDKSPISVYKRRVVRERGSRQVKKDLKDKKISLALAYRKVRESEPKAPPPLPDKSGLAFERRVKSKLQKGVGGISSACIAIEDFEFDAGWAKLVEAVAARLEESAATLRQWAKRDASRRRAR
jgi:ParB-like chromosome segregation protein Spo0J